ncbi:hypothetical protein [Persicobacter sp. CCB-QB2]|uniref:hypothetical protein n=1 Tax=Persicobacter sp. CCB-QB2 TaxID=1561025 RepID=UPI0006A9BFCF|nr:hypothetical protein [Persicobacter sp. CCB-QB2]
MARVQIISNGKNELKVERDIDTCEIKVYALTDGVDCLVIKSKCGNEVFRLWLNPEEQERILLTNKS